jgi:hypothetical protein
MQLMGMSMQYNVFAVRAILLVLVMLLPTHAFAACSSPAGNAGQMLYNKDYHVLQYCNGAKWLSLGPSPGTGGAGCTSPTGAEGRVTYNADYKTVQYCDGTNWRPTSASLCGYQPVPIHFDGSSWQKRGGALTSIANSKSLTFSVWFRSSTIGDYGRILSSPALMSGGLSINFNVDGTLSIKAQDSTGTDTINTYVDTVVEDGQWHHVVASFDGAAGIWGLYLDGISTGVTYTLPNTNSKFIMSDWGIGVDPQNNWSPFNGDMADLWVDFGTYIDLSNPANRAKFYSGGAVNLGADGSLPTGTAPEIFVSGALAGWGTNKGTGGGFTATGTLTAGGTPVCRSY